MRNAAILVYLFSACIVFEGKIFAQDSLARAGSIKDSIERSVDSVLADFRLMKVRQSFWLADVNFLDNNVYLGRKDSIPSPYLTASVGYFHKSGLFINASTSYLLEAGQNRIDLSTIDGGYSLITKKFEGTFTISKYFFSPKSYNVRSEIEGSAQIFGAYDLGFIKPTLEATLNFTEKTDYGGTIGLEHTFYTFQNDFTITPTIVANGSTQNYYNAYYKFRRYSLLRLKKVIGYVINAYVENASQFKILDYEFSMPLDYSIKRFTISFSPTYAVPVNAAVVHATLTTLSGITRTKIAKEKLKNSFFFTIGLAFSF